MVQEGYSRVPESAQGSYYKLRRRLGLEETPPKLGAPNKVCQMRRLLSFTTPDKAFIFCTARQAVAGLQRIDLQPEGV